MNTEDPIGAICVEIDNGCAFYRKTSSEFLLQSLAVQADDGTEVILMKENFCAHIKANQGLLRQDEPAPKCVKVEKVRMADVIPRTVAAQSFGETFNDVQRQLTILTKEMGELKATNTTLTKKVAELTKEVDESKVTNITLTKKVDELTKEVDELNVTNTTLTKKVDELNATNITLTKKVDELTTEVDESTKKLDALKIGLYVADILGETRCEAKNLSYVKDVTFDMLNIGNGKSKEDFFFDYFQNDESRNMFITSLLLIIPDNFLSSRVDLQKELLFETFRKKLEVIGEKWTFINK